MITSNHTIPGTARVPRWKRALDIGLIVVALPLLIPLGLAIAAIIRLVSKGPIFYKQQRIGLGGQKFLCFKFRTMSIGADTVSHEGHLRNLIQSDSPMTKMDSHGDSRIIPLGVFIRALGLDELPQLINVVRGEMSIVGPRPCLPYEFELYLPWQRERCNAAPGLTGLWQVSGKNKTTFSKMIRLDIEYSRRCNLLLDLGIIFRTIPVLLSQASSAQKKRISSPKAITVESENIFPAHAANQ
ncbi:MAG TPA: sugar transferase [Candidatus Acidoferrales bacterium]|jgi:lipopolysaccharide/colanic/teichoic acid biosynthesis glycosyltransferase|nr:sugar transferase [Candidatus Acidoferrales bacterium]